jgi:glycosyltransferase involved in cell wall biosynthesis
MKLSIITVNYRSWGHLESALVELRKDFPDDWEVIVVDNESDPESFDTFSARFPWVKFIANPMNSGFGFGCNIGVAAATGEQLLFMNPDVIASSESIQALIDVKKQHNIGIVAPQQVSSNGKPQKVFDDFPSLLNQSKTVKALLRLLLPSRFPNPRGDYTELTYCDWVTGSVLLIDRADFDTIGGWTEDYWMYVEAVKSMTKLEVIISKHVYTTRHTAGLNRWLTHALIMLLRLPMLVVASVLDLVTLHQVPALRVRSRMLIGLLQYYFGVVRNGSWLSPRAIANQASSE